MKRTRRSETMLAAAFVGNFIVSLIAGQGDAVFPSQDRVVVVDRRTDRVVFRWGGSDVPVADYVNDISADLPRLSIRQFRTKWGIFPTDASPGHPRYPRLSVTL